jgi:hypothetical protein
MLSFGSVPATEPRRHCGLVIRPWPPDTYEQHSDFGTPPITMCLRAGGFLTWSAVFNLLNLHRSPAMASIEIMLRGAIHGTANGTDIDQSVSVCLSLLHRTCQYMNTGVPIGTFAYSHPISSFLKRTQP